MTTLTPELLLHGYSVGIFPMSESRDDPEVFWVDPRRRGILPLDSFHISRSLRRAMRRSAWTVTVDRDFDGVLDGCADREDTWINAEIRKLYGMLFNLGQAHSLEVWDGQTLVGGVYGVVLGGAFFGESMFSRRTNASKIALACLVQHLNDGGFTLFDTQFITDHLASLGAIEISRDKYHSLLSEAKNQPAAFGTGLHTTPQDVMQRITQMS
ncbi:leucyl/phenylalanyl-tRNA--protein transferase [Sulfitobacter donghicola]|uniref:Leucyl/phenylalanyl-tRNA--protein transferase n=1 Tax=Sulfitobacter donghicola DSW-25 = KCTC 12864 = JCM 14565 TaxID=1300350 RepID=A0A073IKY9_9RHOB|nr:leucyl/phenylalanyl-tRNA--protein transferase [Sulfitobacter donghicola]KEJ90166.1 leucyl/phenylalanyl-tRNA--protein transferase [Sulfitobacter donghicola DSW-25 = KCTC 12864 = JCM 14565]KIN66675.1 Leucyl/phenylalanyl-tRNA--protein transferase [Sulfitobacter donghicola DSW-25 = KCTC 12864 = JCM 14565]